MHGIGLLVAGCTFVAEIGLSILSCTVGAQYTADTSTNKIDRGDCESTTSPMVTGETTPVLTYCTWARSSVQHYLGSYSYLMTMSNGGGVSSGIVELNNPESASNMHGLTAGKTYTLQCEMYIPSTNGVDPLHTGITIYYSTNGSTFSSWQTTVVRNIKDAWQKVVVQVTLPSSTTGVMIRVVDTISSNTNILYVDEVYLYESTPITTGLSFSNGYIKSCTNEGIMLICSGASIDHSRIESNANYGIDVVTGQSNTINVCWCANNGSDVGINNANQNNFYDGGLGTIYAG